MKSIAPKKVLFAVIVLYQQNLRDSTSYQSLLKSFQLNGLRSLDLRVLIWDNTPSSKPPTDLPPYVEYFPSTDNSGLASAYDFAWKRALAGRSEWLLTLDQDTALPEEFFSTIEALLNRLSERHEIAAIIPQLFSGNDVLSPYYFAFGAWPRRYPPGYSGIPKHTTFAFNSGAILRVRTLEQIGGYDPRFWLDNSDTALFRKLGEFGKQVYVSGDLVIAHHFSMHELKERVSVSRYRNILLSETAFWDLKMNRLAGIERLLRLIVRCFTHFLHRDSRQIKEITKEFIRRRLILSRDARLSLWEREEAPYLVGNDQLRVDATARPKVSVCMAAYNAGPYIHAQLTSILEQLSGTDEVVVVDDCSTDGTREWLRSVTDLRVRLIEHTQNRGVVKSFEKALRSANGQILFLADNDDLWHHEKVNHFLAAFHIDPQVSLVTSAITLIDGDGNPSTECKDVNRLPFSSGFWKNVYKNRFQGSAMAVRASLLGDIVPFPEGRLFLHDAWIGTRSTLLNRKIAYLPEELLLYRRHSSNLSRRLPIKKQITARLQLLFAHLLRLLGEWIP